MSWRNVFSILLFSFFCTLLFNCSQNNNAIDLKPYNSSPKAEAGPIQFASPGDTVYLDASESTGSRLDFHWTVKHTPDNQSFILSDFESSQPYFNAKFKGTYIFQLTVIDEYDNQDSEMVSIEVMTSSISKKSFNHIGITKSCDQCHYAGTATSRPPKHISASTECAACHNTLAWKPTITINHTELLGSCVNCHNGTLAKGKPKEHVITFRQCNVCHNPGVSFKIKTDSALARSRGFRFNLDRNSFFDQKNEESGRRSERSGDDDDDNRRGRRQTDHPRIGDLQCIDCHNNVDQRGQPRNHIPTTEQCEACHTTSNWERIVTVDHTQLVGGCNSCHRKPANHIETDLQCNECHTSVSWRIAVGNILPPPSPTPPLIAPTPTPNPNPIFDHSTLGANILCVSCHNGITATGKSASHINTSDNCDACHNTNSFIPTFTVNHNYVVGTCQSCHDNVVAAGKPPGHVSTNSDCAVCHRTSAWLPVNGAVGSPGRRNPGQVFDHSTLPPATECISCHNGVSAKGKSSVHIATTDVCINCHSTDSFLTVVSVDHSQVVGNCIDCHNDTVAIGKDISHISSTDNCTKCHSTSIFSPATIVDHSQVIGICIECHNDSIALGKPIDHINTNNLCDNCHSTVNFSPAFQIDHTQVIGACIDCHDGVVAIGKPIGHIASLDSCENCHSTVEFKAIKTIDHESVIGICISCHNNQITTGKPQSHIATSDTCESCHSTVRFSPAIVVDHNEILGDCINCHNNTIATGKSQSHIAVSDICEACHSTLIFLPPIAVDHAQVIGVCTDCHNLPASHIQTTSQCNICHQTSGWILIRNSPTVINFQIIE